MSQTGVEFGDVQANSITVSGVTVGFTPEQVRARITELSRQLGVTQVYLGRLLDTGVRRPVLRHAHLRSFAAFASDFHGRCGRPDLRRHQHHLTQHTVDETR